MQSKFAEIESWVADEASDIGIYDNFSEESYGYIVDAAVGGIESDGTLTVLDVGCASGAVSVRLARRGCVVRGCDISEKLIRSAERHTAVCDVDVGYDVADAEQLPYEDGSFDVVLCVDLLHHFNNIDRVVSELLRVVKRGGRVVTLDPNVLNLHNFLCQSKGSPVRYDKLTVNERAMSSWELKRVYRDHGQLPVFDYAFLTLRRRGEYARSKFLYKVYGFIANSYASMLKRALAIVLFNAAHLLTPLLPKSMRSNTLICRIDVQK
jgi:2-polyprenyl-3-methyl-5-hydroxy-6-metoxy-1,4-benzoquinol methylase